jgi:MFS family permease
VTLPEAQQSPREHAFYLSMALLLVALSAAGFAPTFFARDVAALGPLPVPALVHGIFGTAFVGLLAAQTALIATRRVALHRSLGVAGAAIGVAFVVSGAAVIAALERRHGTEPLSWRAPHLFTNVAPLTLIGRLFGRLDIAELDLVAYATLAFANAGYDWLARGRPHAVSLLGATTLVAVDAVTTAWLAAVGS